MFSNLRSLIFKLDPETAHNLAIKSLKFNFVPNILDEDKDNPLFKTKLFKKDLENPIGMAAGFDKNAEVYNSLFKLGFGFVEVGTITPLKQYGNPKPRIFRLVEDEALINRLGFNNLGAKNVVDRIKSNKQNGLLGINIGPNKDTENRLGDYIDCLKIFHEAADYITINISSPNTEDLRSFHEQTKLNELLLAVDKEKKNLSSKIPIAVKVSPDIDDKEINKISEVLLNNNIEVIIISNTSDSTRDGLNNIQRHQKGGLSGKPIEEKSTRLINKFYKILNGRIKIIGVGGVDSGKNAYEKFLAGANYVQLYTGMVFRGPNIVNMIKKELKELLIKDGVKNFTEIIGKKQQLKSYKLDEISNSPYIVDIIMSKKCELTGKNPMKGHNVSHANNKTKRRFFPNLKKVKFTSELLKRSLKLTVSNAGVRSVDKKGSFDEFLKTVKNKDLSPRLKKMKKSLLIKSPFQKKAIQSKSA